MRSWLFVVMKMKWFHIHRVCASKNSIFTFLTIYCCIFFLHHRIIREEEWRERLGHAKESIVLARQRCSFFVRFFQVQRNPNNVPKKMLKLVLMRISSLPAPAQQYDVSSSELLNVYKKLNCKTGETKTRRQQQSRMSRLTRDVSCWNWIMCKRAVVTRKSWLGLSLSHSRMNEEQKVENEEKLQ